jgi:CTP:molybdopterin cytidylyltransferase MocA
VISALVLGAGEGKRFGGTKQLEIVRGKPLIQHAVDAASGAGVGEIVVVLGHDALAVRDALDLPEGGRFVLNERYSQGQSTSLAAGLRALDPSSEAAVVLLADQPGIESRHVASLVSVLRDESRVPECCSKPGPTGSAGSSSTRTPRSTSTDGPTWNGREAKRPGRLHGRGASNLRPGREGLAVEDDGHPEVPV